MISYISTALSSPRQHCAEGASPKSLVFGLLSLPLSLLLSFTASAQFDQTINVSGEYIPEVIDHNRISSFPAKVRFAAADSELDYDLRAVTADFSPRGDAMFVIPWGDRSPWPHARGYVNLALGSWLNASLDAGYRFADSRTTKAGIAFQHNSTSLWHPKVDGIRYEHPQWRYDETLSLYAHHDLSPAVRLNADAAWNINFFNYYGVDTSDQPDQTLNRGSFRIGLSSIPASLPAYLTDPQPPTGLPLQWNADIRASYFGFNRLPGENDYNGLGQTDLGLSGNVDYAFNRSSSLGLDLDARWLIYASQKKEERLPAIAPDNYGNISLTPRYRYASTHFNMTLGAKLDITPGIAGYKSFHAAPAVKLAYTGSPFSVWVNVLGGQTLRTADWLYLLDPYCSPTMASVTPMYAPVDATLGFRLTPFSGFTFGADIEYMIAKNVPYGGDYMANLAFGYWDIICGAPARDASPASYDLTGFSAGVNLGLDFSPWFSLSAEGRYQPQSRDEGFFNGYDRPRWTLGLAAETNPWSPLRIALTYEYRGVRTLYLDHSAHSLPDLTLLGAMVSYQITPRIAAYVKADNLLNRHDELLPAAPSQGLSIMAGASFLFQ